VLGSVRFFDIEKGFGFIIADSGAADIFVHHSALVGIGKLDADQRVIFDVAQSPKGPRATNVRSAERTAQGAQRG
jgi:CspA family cold shock protein